MDRETAVTAPAPESVAIPRPAPDASGRAVLDAMDATPHLSVIVVDRDLRYRAVLGGAVPARGYDPAAMLGRPVADVVPAASFTRIEPLLRRALSGETVVDVAETPDGAAVWETTYGPVTERGSVTGALAVVRDVTAERRAAAELAAGDARLRMLLGNVSDVVLVTSAADRFAWVSPSMGPVLGWEPGELVGRSVYDIVHPDEREQVRALREAALAGAGQALMTYRFHRPDGRWVWVESLARRVPDITAVLGPGAASIAGLVVTIRDITDRHRLKIELAQALETFELSFAAAPIGKALIGPDGRFLKVNDALCGLLGRSEAELLAVTFRDLTHPEDLAVDEDLLRETAAGQRDGYRLEKRYLLPDGSTVWGLLAVAVVRAADGGPRFFISQIEDITDRKSALREMERTATTDALTGLPNRLLLMDRLRHALALARRSGGLVGVAFVDLDGFKAVNDALGHDAGDELLRQAARRLQRAAREGDTTTRLGGDEFVVVCEQVASIDQVAAIAERLRAELERPFRVFGHDVRISGSIGVTAGRSADAEALLREADRTMYAVKRARPGRVDVYAEALEALAHDQLALHAQLGVGITRGELRVFYQPIVDLRTGEAVAHEALVRWEHPTRGLLLPSAFLDGVDRTPLGIALGEHVVERACADAVTWDEDLVVHVNVSARHLAQPRFAHFVDGCLRATGLSADRLVLEITESLVLAASPSTLTSAHALADLGVGLSLDDFGTGYSSIAALNRIPLDSFKIDRSFVADVLHQPTSAALVEGLISLGAHMDLDVVAEGVETADHAEWLTSRGCPYGQGYHLGRARPLG